MNFWTEWLIATHRAFWFPVLWFTGLESTALSPGLFDPRWQDWGDITAERPLPLRRAA